MAKKKRAETVAAVAPEIKAPVRPSVSFRVMNNCGPVPIAKPADFIQLTPIVQPIAFVPYSTQAQPLATFDDEY
ncbi:MAG: hypothetical protein ACOYIQ_06420 [Christensenellales bacterium]|jgi:hypothetical protein